MAHIFARVMVSIFVVGLPVMGLSALVDDPALITAAQTGDLVTARSLLSEGVDADVDASQPDGTTALAWSAHRDNLEMVELFIEAGADVDRANAYGISPLALACTNGSAPVVRALLDAEADPNAADWTGETVLMTCARAGSREAVLALLEAGADANAREDTRGQTVLMWAVAENHAGVAEALIEDGAEVGARSMAGVTPLMFAAQEGSVEAGRALLAGGAELDEFTPQNGSALVVASANGQEAFSLFLLENGANPDVRDADGVTALHYAIKKGISDLRGDAYTPYRQPPPPMPKLVKALLDRGADANAQILKDYPRYSRSPARSIAGVAGATGFFLASLASDIEAMRQFVAAGIDLGQAADDETTPLMAAAGVGRVYVRNEEEQRPALEAVRLILELGFDDINAVNERGQTALHGAAYNGSNSMVQLLVDHGARLDVADTSGKTPLAVADGKPTDGVYGHVNHPSTVNLLRSLGAQ
jgi:ankyrin repeat protein